MNAAQQTSTTDIQRQIQHHEGELARLRSLFREVYQQEESERQSQQLAAGVSNACGKSWRADGSCSYCGSMTVARAIELLKTTGTEYSGADWKYGWPHKFYLGTRKFYNNHLTDATDAEFSEFAAISAELLGVKWTRDENGVKYSAPGGIQAAGIVGGERKVYQ